MLEITQIQYFMRNLCIICYYVGYPVLSLLAGAFLERVLNFVMGKFRVLDTVIFKFAIFYVLILGGLGYLFLNRELVYTTDLTGSQARLLKLKDEKFGVSEKVYVDRVELPLVMYYTDGPFKIIDFHHQKLDGVPVVGYENPTILITKKGRFNKEVVTYSYPPKIVKEDGDYVLWYFDSRKDVYEERLRAVREKIEKLEETSIEKFGGVIYAPTATRDKYSALKVKEVAIKEKIDLNQGITP